MRKRKKTHTKNAVLKTHHQDHSSAATEANSRRRAAKYVPYVTQPKLARFFRRRFVEIGHVQLSQPIILPKNADRQYTTDRQSTQTKEACTHLAMKSYLSPVGKKRPDYITPNLSACCPGKKRPHYQPQLERMLPLVIPRAHTSKVTALLCFQKAKYPHVSCKERGCELAHFHKKCASFLFPFFVALAIV